MILFSYDSGASMHALMAELYPVCRSLTGPGVRKTLAILLNYLPITVHEIPSGTQVFDWTVPKEWLIRDAYLINPKSKKIVDFKRHNLHVVGYSVPVDTVLPLDDLQPHLYSLPNLPDAIPYVTSYYKEHWGFCLTQRQRDVLENGMYRVVIDSELIEGSLTYGELLIPGKVSQEIFLSTYICHPSMANNELSGPVVATALAQWILSKPRHYSYRIVFVPETIGSLVYLSRNLEIMKKRIVAGFNLTCMGDERAWSFLPSRSGETLADRAAHCVLREQHPEFIHYSFLDRGSDERQYCSPGVDLPVVSIMRSKYREYPEYHTSLDNLELVTPAGLEASFLIMKDCLEVLERNRIYRSICLGEPQLGKYGLYPTVGTRDSHRQVRDILNTLAYADGTQDLIALSSVTRIPPHRLHGIIEKLKMAGLLVEVAGS